MCSTVLFLSLLLLLALLCLDELQHIPKHQLSLICNIGCSVERVLELVHLQVLKAGDNFPDYLVADHVVEFTDLDADWDADVGDQLTAGGRWSFLPF